MYRQFGGKQLNAKLPNRNESSTGLGSAASSNKSGSTQVDTHTLRDISLLRR